MRRLAWILSWILIAGAVWSATAAGTTMTKAQMFAGLQRVGMPPEFERGATLVPLGDIHARGRCYHIVYVEWVDPDADPGAAHGAYKLAVFSCARRILGVYEVPGGAIRPYIYRTGVDFAFTGTAGDRIDFANGPPDSVEIGGETALFGRPADPNEWTDESIKAALVRDGFGGSLKGSVDIGTADELKAGGRCYKVVTYGRMPDGTPAADPNTPGLERRLLVFTCDEKYLGGYGPLPFFPEKRNGNTFAFYGDTLTFGKDGPPRSVVIADRTFKFRK